MLDDVCAGLVDGDLELFDIRIRKTGLQRVLGNELTHVLQEACRARNSQFVDG